VLGVSPAGFVRGDVALGASLERHCLGGIKLRSKPRGLALVDRVAAVEPRLAAAERLFARLGKADRVGRAEPHLAQLAVNLEPEDPAFCAAGAHLEEQPAAVAVVASPLRLRDGQRR
jgi:hypothetical protein